MGEIEGLWGEGVLCGKIAYTCGYRWGEFFQGAHLIEREPGGRRLVADIRSPLEGGREVTGAVMGCAEGLVHVGVF